MHVSCILVKATVLILCFVCRLIYEEDMDGLLKTLAAPKLRETADADSCSSSAPECAICLQRCVHPVRLPCYHIFCFLCVKGASWHSKRCALCRQEIPEDFLERPVLLLPEELKAAAAGVIQTEGTDCGSCGEFAWYYEGRNGWWQYDERTSHELEEAFNRAQKSTEVLIAGFLYVADFENMVQYRRNEHGRRRRIKRDMVDIPKKGVAGLRLDSEPPLPVVAPGTREHIISPHGRDAASQPQFGFVASLPPVRPPTLLGHHLRSHTTPSLMSLEDSFSQLLIGQPESEEMSGEDELRGSDFAFCSSESEEERERGAQTAESTAHTSLRENRPVRMPPRGGSATSPSRSPDGQCTVTEV